MRQAMSVPFGRSLNGRVVPWPRRPGGTSRTRRKIELWERVGEEFPASTVLEDLGNAVGDVDAAQRILARFAAIRVILLVLHGDLTSAELSLERDIARSYAEVLPEGDPERRVLTRLVSLAKPRLRRGVIACANDAGELATQQSHAAGAFWLHHVAYAVAVACGWRSEAHRAARAIEEAAAFAGAVRSQRLWRARAVALETRGD
jgi:hypothetical protein